MRCHTHLRLISRRRMITAGLALGICAPAVLRSKADARDRPLLTISDSSGRSLAFDEESYAALPWQVVRTHTPWTEGPQEFHGPLMRDVLSAFAPQAEIAGKNLLMRALNDFTVEVPADDAWRYGPLLARDMNGQPMELRDKGPIWLIYPRDDRPEVQVAAFDERWIWQLSTIQII